MNEQIMMDGLPMSLAEEGLIRRIHANRNPHNFIVVKQCICDFEGIDHPFLNKIRSSLAETGPERE